MSSPITRHAVGRYAVGLAAVALVGACSSGPSAATATTRPTPTAAAKPTYPSDVPAAAQANTPAGALAFARYFFGRLNAAYATGQTGLLHPLGTAKCAGCGTLEDEAAAVTSGGRHTVSEPMLLREVTASNEPHIEGQTPVDVLFRLRAVKIVDSAGAAAGAVKEKNGIYLVSLLRDGAVWRVSSITLMQ